MKTVTSYNKQSGITYVYEILENRWNPEKKRGETVRRLIGKVDPQTGQVVPTGKRGRPKKNPDAADSVWRKKFEDKSAELDQAKMDILSQNSHIRDLEQQISTLERKYQELQSKWAAFQSDLCTLVQSAPTQEDPYEPLYTKNGHRRGRKTSSEESE